MFQKSFMPLFAMLVVISMAFLIFFRITVVREKQKDRENDQIRLETCVSSTELHMKEIEKWGKQLLNGVDLQKFVYMYDDLDRYSRFSLQNEIYESVYDLYYKNAKEIGISAVRGGSIVGDHEVLFCGPDEVITLRHTAYSRNIFANGAINAAVYLAKKEPGLYNMSNMIAEM